MSTISQPTRVRPKPQLSKGRGCRKERPVTTGPAAPADSAFLNYQFPILTNKGWRWKRHQEAIEATFFSALQNVCSLYDLTMPDVSDQPYPYSIYYAHKVVDAELQLRHSHLCLHLFEDEEGGFHVGTLSTYSVGNTFFFVPVQPVLPLLKRKKKHATGQLILSIMAWLHRVVGIPFFTDESCYVTYTYDCIENMLLDSGDEYEEAERQEYIDEMQLVKSGGRKVFRLINQPRHLDAFEKRVQSYSPNTLVEAVLLVLAQKALQLYQEFPTRSYLHQLQSYGEEQDYYEMVQMDKYLSFYWSWKGYSGEQLVEYANCDLSNAVEVEEPQSIQLFDTPQEKETHDFSFEDRLFDILDSLIYVLTNLP